jgi:hypothetical protein
MRRLTVAVILVLVGATTAPAADQPEDRAEAAAVAFLKAVRDRDLDAVLARAATPFAYMDGKLAVHRDAAALRRWAAGRLDAVASPDQVPVTVERVVPFAAVRGGITDPKDRERADEVIGPDGLVAWSRCRPGPRSGWPSGSGTARPSWSGWSDRPAGRGQPTFD